MVERTLIERLNVPWPEHEVEEVTLPAWILELCTEAATTLTDLEAENARLKAELAEALKALEPFADIAGEPWADENGWTNAACPNDRICDWFGPSDFRTARRVREGGKVDG